MRVIPIPCLEDNYAYLLDDGRGQLAVVDPSEAEPVEKAVRDAGGRLTAVLATHHHQDHIGGIAELVASRPGMPVFAHRSDRGRIPAQTVFLDDGATCAWSNLAIRALHVPGHTRGAVAYVVDDAVFTGDTMFVAGCGRLFEGTPEMMHHSLNVVLGGLPDAVRVYCGHEYTVSNLLFALSVEPIRVNVAERLYQARVQRAAGKPTIGGTMADERATNPFLRCKDPSIKASLGLPVSASEVESFAALRRAKDVYRPPT